MQKYTFYTNITAIIMLSTVFSVALPRIKTRIEKNYFAFLLFMLLLVCILTVLSFYKIAFDRYFLLIRSMLQPILVSTTTYYIYYLYLRKNE